MFILIKILFIELLVITDVNILVTIITILKFIN